MEILNKKFDRLTVRCFDTREEAGTAAAADAASRISRIIAAKGAANVVFAAAPSQNELLASLVKSSVDWSHVRALHMDEYIGLPEDHPAGFGNYLDRAIFGKVKFMEIHYLKNAGATPEAACAAYSALLAKYPPDLILLGVGENGHLAFNDPETADFSDPLAVKIVTLDDVCRMQQVNDGCFSSIDEVPKKAITLSMSAISAVPEAVAIVPGKLKAAAVAAMLHGDVSIRCPAGVLRRHPSAALYIDADSASMANLF